MAIYYALILHFIRIVFKLSIFQINLITVLLFIINITLEVIIITKLKVINNKVVYKVKQEELNKFIEDFKLNKLNYYLMGEDLKEEVEFLLGGLELSGKSYIVLGTLIILVFICKFFYKNLNNLFIIPILIIIPLIYMFIKLSLNIIDVEYENNYGDRKNKRYIDTICFIIGYAILFSEEVFFYNKVGYFNVSIWVIVIILFLPSLITRFNIRNKFEKVYIKYKKSISGITDDN